MKETKQTYKNPLVKVVKMTPRMHVCQVQSKFDPAYFNPQYTGDENGDAIDIN